MYWHFLALWAEDEIELLSGKSQELMLRYHEAMGKMIHEAETMLP